MAQQTAWWLVSLMARGLNGSTAQRLNGLIGRNSLIGLTGLNVSLAQRLNGLMT
jgi:hypothetical protein